MPARQLILACTVLLLCLSTIAQPIKRFDIVIDELLPDPSPPVQLPNSEFIELKNTSINAVNLRQFKLTDGSTTATITTDFILQPDSFVIICPSAAAPFFSRALGVTNFPSLNNDADIISLYAPNGALIHSISYNSNWYQNAVKSDGGWSLEMIDPNNPCTGASNWQASIDNSGGTPGRKNSIDRTKHDDLPPALLSTYTIDSITIVAVFDEPIDSTTASLTANYSIAAVSATPMYNEVILKLPAALQSHTVYQLIVKNITDCSGNTIGQLNTTKAGLPTIPEPFTVVINELLFNPPPDGYDYLELYNRSNAIIDLKSLRLTDQPRLLFPGEYSVITANKQWVQQHYLVKDPSLILESPNLPSMPDDKGTIVLLNQQGTIIDSLHYDEKWHFSLIDNKEGIALERINYNLPTQDKTNWSSAASTANYGTPGYPNSQLRADLQPQGSITITPAIISPNNDGHDDFATIICQTPEPGYVANIIIFDAQGHRIRQLVQQATLSRSNQFRWDGLDDKMNKLPAGNYIIFTQLFNLSGTTKKYKNVVTLVRR